MNALFGSSLLILASGRSLSDGSPLQVVGTIIAIVVLGAISLILVNRNKTRLQQLQEPAVPLPSSPLAAAVTSPAPAETVPPEIRAAIAAAIYVTETGAFRIVKIEAARDERMQAWSIEGRRQIFHSHQIR